MVPNLFSPSPEGQAVERKQAPQAAVFLKGPVKSVAFCGGTVF